MRSVLLALGLAFLASLFGCKTFGGKLPSGEIVLPDPLDDAFRALLGHHAITPSESLVIYGTEDAPNFRTRCHEAFHRDQQAKKWNDAAVASGEIPDTERARFIHWLLVYGQAAVEAELDGKDMYDNRIEKAARDACP